MANYTTIRITTENKEALNNHINSVGKPEAWLSPEEHSEGYLLKGKSRFIYEYMDNLIQSTKGTNIEFNIEQIEDYDYESTIYKYETKEGKSKLIDVRENRSIQNLLDVPKEVKKLYEEGVNQLSKINIINMEESRVDFCKHPVTINLEGNTFEVKVKYQPNSHETYLFKGFKIKKSLKNKWLQNLGDKDNLPF